MKNIIYSIENVSKRLAQSLHQYLEAQYHIWDENIINERKHLLDSPGVIFQEPRLEATPFYALGNTYSELQIPSPARVVLESASKLKVGVYEQPFLHQAKALESFLGENGRDVIVATGTGSGKTESFLMPILGSLAIESATNPESSKLPGCRAILLYPMNALVNDQLSRLRRLFGNEVLAKKLAINRNRLVKFGMYTGRTPYPGSSSVKKDNERLKPVFEKLYLNLSDANKEKLKDEGKWPSKDMQEFVENGFITGVNDRELLTRQEMQKVCPDLLVTNYSMLEYMLLRPIESSIFDQTATWLRSNSENRLTIVLDEAHMYRGATGAEVAMLLRRLQARLQVDRSKIRYILTSASLGTSKEAKTSMLKFASDLTGADEGKDFELITGELEKINYSATGSTSEIEALSELNIEDIHALNIDFNLAKNAINKVMNYLNKPEIKSENEKDLKDECFNFLNNFGPSGLLSETITGNPQTFNLLAEKIFDKTDQGKKALESLVAISNFARRKKDDRVYLPIRLHLMFRGLSGVYACSNPTCEFKRDKNEGSSYLGRLHDSPKLQCECGARVYELLTHRDCGAAFLRGYMKSEHDDFLWHESTKLPRPKNNQLIEAHFLVETDRDQASKAAKIWLHIPTGKISRSQPHSTKISDYLSLLQPQSFIDSHGNRIVSFHHDCPVCLKGWRGETKIMDLATKGEAPFAHLIKTQVRLQPPTKEKSSLFPNQGRKSLLFSDGRQKAARLARDIPREVERDVFRQAIVLAVRELQNISGKEPRLDSVYLYTAFIYIASKFSLSFFDGQDSDTLSRHVEEFKLDYKNLEEALGDVCFKIPPLQYSANLLRVFGNPFYSLHALNIAYITPTRLILNRLSIELNLKEDEVKILTSVWIQSLLNSFAFDDSLGVGVRISAAGYVSANWGEDKALNSRQRSVITGIMGDIKNIDQVIEKHLTTRKNNLLFLLPGRLKLELGLDKEWYQCKICTYVTFGILKGCCVNCGSNDVLPINPEKSNYLRARKTFWRDPIVSMLAGKEEPFNLDVQEHTAQLSHRDVDDPGSTTEEYERRFRDIIVHDGEKPIDVLSSTTTMEVGIDIGSLVGVGLRNVPPMRQNYQQRAGRAGRRGSSVSTVITYAQNSPHDNFYFTNPEKIIAGDPPLPSIDISNPRIIERHIHAVLLQTFFHEQIATLSTSSNIFSVLGDTWDFYEPNGVFSIVVFEEWLSDVAAESIFNQISSWIPKSTQLDPKLIGKSFINSLLKVRPKSKEGLIGQSKFLIEFLFENGFLPSYAFPRDLCALQIETIETKNSLRRVKVVERPQQSLNVALSEYAPGRLVVINKKTYRIGTVAAATSSTTVDRSIELFEKALHYLHCPECIYTRNFNPGDEIHPCPLCGGMESIVMEIIQPEVVFPEGGNEIDELDDEQIRSTVTGAQLPVIEHEDHFKWLTPFPKGSYTSAENQLLVMFNKGEENSSSGGFLICNKCGKANLSSSGSTGMHDRDYKIDKFPGQNHPYKCNGEFRNVFLGYNFRSDILLFRIQLTSPFILNISQPLERKPLEDALTSLADAILLSTSHVLDVDVRELNAGFRFLSIASEEFVDLFIYDTLAGGAGYAHMAASQFLNVISQAETLLDNCVCQSSCDKCLRHYGNRSYHANLDRFLALDLLRYIKTGIAPQIKTISEQTAELSQLEKMLELAGWTVTHDDVINPTKAKLGDKEFLIATYPALTNPKALPHPLLEKAILISSYELKRDLPGAFIRVSENQ